jgi:hypothetical protein
MEINLLALSTYNVEQIQKNKEFFNTLISRIKSTYMVFKYSESDWQNTKSIEFAPTQSRIQNVFINMNVNGEVKFTFVVSRGVDRLEDLKSKYVVYKMTHDTRLIIEGVNSENYTEHLPYIVKGIEYCEYSFR